MTLNKRGGVAKWGEIISAELFRILFICKLHLHSMYHEYLMINKYCQECKITLKAKNFNCNAENTAAVQWVSG